jgi:hypothetical protein
MGGGLLQLVAYGAQDVYITGNPQVTFFKLVYRRHTNFSMETIEQTFNGNPDFGKKVTCTLSRNGDLIHKIWLWVTLGDVKVKAGNQFRWLNWLGHLMINYVEFEIGGQKIDKQYGEWMQIYCELTMKAGHSAGYGNMVGNTPALTNMRNTTETCDGTTLYIPLQFYFCRNPGLAVPLVALQYHEVKINIEFRPLADCVHSVQTSDLSYVVPEGAAMKHASLLVDYVFLDSDERRRFAQISHEYLITQLQFTGEESVSTTSAENSFKFRLAFNHPTKEIVWVAVKEDFIKDVKSSGPPNGRQWFNFTTKVDKTYLTGTALDPLGGGIGFGGSVFDDLTLDSAASNIPNAVAGVKDYTKYDFGTLSDIGTNPTMKAKLVLNGHDRFAERDGRWFNLAVPYATHENIPPTGINVYAFGLRPEEHQPSGSINFSRIDTANLHVSLHGKLGETIGYKVKIYAVSYNILRIMSGMGGLAYSN